MRTHTHTQAYYSTQQSMMQMQKEGVEMRFLNEQIQCRLQIPVVDIWGSTIAHRLRTAALCQIGNEVNTKSLAYFFFLQQFVACNSVSCRVKLSLNFVKRLFNLLERKAACSSSRFRNALILQPVRHSFIHTFIYAFIHSF